MPRFAELERLNVDMTTVTEQDVNRRRFWIEEIRRLSGDFVIGSDRVEREIAEEIERDGISPLLSHLRLCGAIPESYDHDSSEEKLYSKYTDVVISAAYASMGFTSLVLRERADSADVECVCDDYSFVADAKAFRMSRTAKNQKDFKVLAMDNWKHGKPFAMIVCPVYQLPSRISQIYQQAASRSVCVYTYTHLAVLVRYAETAGQRRAIELLLDIFRTVEAMNPSKSANLYWQALNRKMLDAADGTADLWRQEKIASVESIRIGRDEALGFLAGERERIMKLSRSDAIREVIRWRRIDNKVRVVESVADRGLLEIE